MIPISMSKKEIAQYIVVLYVISWLIQLVAIYLTEVLQQENARTWLLAFTMLTPALITLLSFWRNPSWKAYLLWRPNVKVFAMSFYGIVVPILIAFSVLAIHLMSGFGRHDWFSFSIGGVNILNGPWVLGKGQGSWIFFLCNIFLTGVVFSIFNGVIAAGEEMAWRGFLQNVLIDKVGITKGIVLLGLIWSFWHLPIFLAGHNEPEYPVLGTFVIQPVRLVALSFFWGWLTMVCRSFIPAALAHGALNSIQEGIISNIQLATPTIYRDLITLSITIGVGIFGYFLVKKQVGIAVCKPLGITKR